MPVPIDLNVPHVEEAAIEVDARADEPAWADALVVDEFVVYYPVPDTAPVGHATVRVLSDDEALYVFWDVVDPEPEQVRARMANRDNIWGDDWVGIYLDPSAQGQRAYLIMANPLGVQTDATRLAGGNDRTSWDGQWRSAGRLTETGYQVEFAIPWRTVRHPDEVDELGLSFLRMCAREAERSGWPRRDPEVSGILVQEYVVGGPGPLPASRGVSLVPELTFGWTDEGPSERWGSVGGLNLGATLRFDPRPGITTLATFNPDFSNVETDALQLDVNNRFPLSYAERRPFFFEGQEWFESEMPNLIYTRSVVSPRYGARVVAEEGPWKLAMMHALDGSPQGSVSNQAAWRDEELEGELAFNTIVRGRRDLSRDSYVGLVYTDKSVPGAELSNRVGFVDTRFRVSDRLVASGAVGGSSTTLSSGERLVSSAGRGQLSYESLRADGRVSTSVLPKGFRAETGFITRSDVITIDASGRLKAYPRVGPARQVGLRPMQLDVVTDTTGRPLDMGMSVFADAQLGRNSSVEFWLTSRDEQIEDVWLSYRGGGFFLGGEPTRWLDLGGWVTVGQGPSYELLEVGDRARASAWSTLKLGRRVRVGGSLDYDQLFLNDDLLYRGYVARGSLNVYATRAHYARLLYDHNGFTGYDRAQLLLAWQQGPNRAAWLGGIVSEEEDGVGWQVFGKLSWVFAR